MKNNYTERIKTAVSKAIEGDSNITDEIRVLEGCSSPKIRHLLNNLIKSGDRYLEVGCYKGSTSISSLYSKHVDDYFLTCVKFSISYGCFTGFKGHGLRIC